MSKTKSPKAKVSSPKASSRTFKRVSAAEEKKIRALLLKNVPQREIAAKVGRSQSTISGYANGRTAAA
jgi:predicted transcriptional regulator